MSKYKEVILPIVEDANVKAYQVATLISILGIAVLGCTVGFLEVGAFRTIGVVVALVLIGAPFALRFFIDQHKKIGVIRFSEFEILIKLSGQEPQSFDTKNIESIQFNIVDYEGETKVEDLRRSSSTMNVRSGADNIIYWRTKDAEHEYKFKFKLSSELQKRKALHFLKIIEKQIMETN